MNDDIPSKNNAAKTKLLLVEDDQEIARLTRLYLEADGYWVDVVDDGAEAVAAVAERQPDLIILDLMLPNVSGHAICRQLREEQSPVPILVLTACDDDLNEVSLLKLGADDYLNKPLKPHILVARIEALLRRCDMQQSTECQVLSVDYENRSARFSGRRLELTDAEYEMLLILDQRRGEIVSREECCHALRGIDYDFSDRSIDMRISGLRRKFGDSNKPYKIIVTVRNKGYKLCVE